ncbi:hypothetical protein [Candidatus Nitrosotalea okcheonensis]|uniref:Uncharacterized protein n=1 Tax=Candidatus Nitrosotalea okcheonensis TaxID=1903276 RepID=A0A2H1FC53_9ARCH|nr:hypothetical protein [Candidatus Nitrosotalea okcheonensis]SMH70346.1 exported protein of unknown function [Candidatus Nitrosotalea okcheonensis]
MSNVAKVIGILVVVVGFLAFVHTTFGYEDAVKKLGLNVYTSPEGKKTLEHWGIEAVIIGIGLGILALGIWHGRRSD